jgi:tungstate transport system permease protein
VNELPESLRLTRELLVAMDPGLVEIVSLSLWVSLNATALAALVGLPLGAAAAVLRFPGRSVLVSLLNASMGLPPVVVGLAVYLMLSRAGPLGELGLLFTPEAMIIAQFLLITPIIAALTRQTLADLDEKSREQLQVLNTSPFGMLRALLWDARFSLVSAVLAGFGRAIAEVGAVLIVGGNISGVTRVMTSAIAQETSRGNLAMALALGLILISLAVTINLLIMSLSHFANRRYA